MAPPDKFGECFISWEWFSGGLEVIATFTLLSLFKTVGPQEKL